MARIANRASEVAFEGKKVFPGTSNLQVFTKL
jgi:hypothetical protein